ncbi:MAG: polysaccharide biosynthesis C-terminal domain-containing protein [Chloroflexi bacterium]|nr:polysaccharide biosynthesis C-terminal domain-containing protein [Chloroflexota bacterium]
MRVIKQTVLGFSAARHFRPFFGFLGGDVVSYLISLVIFSLIARTVGPNGYGYLALGTSVTLWLELVVVFGLNLVGAGWVAAHPERGLHILKRTLSFRLVVSALLSVGLGISTMLLVADPVLRYVLWARCMIILAAALDIGYLFVGLGNPLPFVIGSISWRLLFLLLLWATLRRDSPLAFVPLENGLAMLGTFAGLIYWAIRFIPRTVPQTETGFVLPFRVIITQGIPVMLATAAMKGYYNLGVLLLGIWAMKADVGTYAAAIRILQISLFVLVALLRTFGPRLAAISAGGDKVRFDRAFTRYKRVCWIIGLLGAMGIFVCARPATALLLDRDFGDTGRALQILSLSFLAISMHSPYSSAFPFIGAGKDHLWAHLSGFVVNGLSNLVLVPRYGYVGASVSAIMGGVAIWGYAYLAFHRWYSCFDWKSKSLEIAH